MTKAGMEGGREGGREGRPCYIFWDRQEAKVMRPSSFTTMTRSGRMARIREMR